MTIRHLVKEATIRAFLAMDDLGVHVLPKHYYSSVPDHRWLRENPDAWQRRAPLAGVAWDLKRQLGWLDEVCRPYYPEVAGLSFYDKVTANDVGPGFGPIESQVVHCVVRATGPRRIVEIGSGVSTLCMVHAAGLNERNGKPSSSITCIEPYPRKNFLGLRGITHLPRVCQTVPDAVFEQLEAGDLLFVDSSHAVKCGSDVLKIWLDVVPRLPAGVLVHAHDIFLPYLFHPEVATSYFDWQETSLLLALLTNNPRLSILAALYALHGDESAALGRICSDYRPGTPRTGGHYPSSLWLRTG